MQLGEARCVTECVLAKLIEQDQFVALALSFTSNGLSLWLCPIDPATKFILDPCSPADSCLLKSEAYPTPPPPSALVHHNLRQHFDEALLI